MGIEMKILLSGSFPLTHPPPPPTPTLLCALRLESIKLRPQGRTALGCILGVQRRGRAELAAITVKRTRG